MAIACRRGVGAAALAVLLLFAGCGGGGPLESEIQGQIPSTVAGTWVWTLTSPFGCPTAVEQDFPFLDQDNKTFEVVEVPSALSGPNGLIGLRARSSEGDFFRDDQGNRVEMTGTFNPLNGDVSATFCITEELRTPVGRPRLCDGKAYIVFDVARESESRVAITAPAGFVCVIDALTAVVLKDIPVGAGPGDLGASPDGRWVAVPCERSNDVYIIDTATDSVADRFEQSTYGFELPTSVTYKDGHWYVANRGLAVDSTSTGFVVIIDASNPLTFTTVPLIGLGTVDVECDPVNPRVACINQDTSTIDFINSTTRTLDAAISNLQTIPRPHQIGFANDGRAVVVGDFTAQYDPVNFQVGVQLGMFTEHPVRGFDVAIRDDLAYITGQFIGAKEQQVGPRMGIFILDMVQRLPAQNQPQVSEVTYGIDICNDGNNALFAAEFFPYGMAIPSLSIDTNPIDGTFSSSGARWIRFVENVFTPRVIKIEFTAFVTFLDDMRQLDGRAVISQTIGFDFQCLTVSVDNVWVALPEIER